MIVGLHHIAIGVPDLGAAIRFYESAFHFEEVESTEFSGASPLVEAAIGLSEPAAKMCMMRTSNAYIELWEYSTPEPRDTRSAAFDHGYPHMAIQVTEIEAEHARLTNLGVKFVGPPVDFGNSAAIYGTDPFGNLLELYEIKDSKRAQIANTPLALNRDQ